MLSNITNGYPQVRYGDGQKVFTPEQITAMMLTYLKLVAEKALGKPVVDCVVSVSLYCDIIICYLQCVHLWVLLY